MPMPISLSRTTQPKEIRRRVVDCRERLRRARGTQKIGARATESEASEKASPSSDAAARDFRDDDETPLAPRSGPDAGGRSVRRLESGAKEEGIEA